MMLSQHQLEERRTMHGSNGSQPVVGEEQLRLGVEAGRSSSRPRFALTSHAITRHHRLGAQLISQPRYDALHWRRRAPAECEVLERGGVGS